MFGHGQVEGYSEQYGMEFRRPQRDETPNEDLVARHRREIFPLLRQRWRFAGWQAFRQLSAFDGASEVPDVFAYANRAQAGPADAGERRSLVVYLNRYPRAHVRIAGAAEALGLGDDPAGYLILHDQRTGLQYLRHLRDTRERGLELSLDGYASHVFLGFEEVSDGDGAGWAELAQRTGLAGVPDAWAALRWLRAEPLRDGVAAVFATATVQAAFLPPQETAVSQAGSHRLSVAPPDVVSALMRLAVLTDAQGDTDELAARVAQQLSAARSIRPRLLAQAVPGAVLFAAIGETTGDGDPSRLVAAFDEWGGAAAVAGCARQAGSGDGQAWRAAELARALLAIAPGALEALPPLGLPVTWFEHAAVREAAGWNRWQEVTYLSREGWAELVDALAARDTLFGIKGGDAAAVELRRRAAASGYRIDQVDTEGTVVSSPPR
jgi:hypothetical protein